MGRAAELGVNTFNTEQLAMNLHGSRMILEAESMERSLHTEGPEASGNQMSSYLRHRIKPIIAHNTQAEKY